MIGDVVEIALGALFASTVALALLELVRVVLPRGPGVQDPGSAEDGGEPLSAKAVSSRTLAAANARLRRVVERGLSALAIVWGVLFVAAIVATVLS